MASAESIYDDPKVLGKEEINKEPTESAKQESPKMDSADQSNQEPTGISKDHVTDHVTEPHPKQKDPCDNIVPSEAPDEAKLPTKVEQETKVMDEPHVKKIQTESDSIEDKNEEADSKEQLPVQNVESKSKEITSTDESATAKDHESGKEADVVISSDIQTKSHSLKNVDDKDLSSSNEDLKQSDKDKPVNILDSNVEGDELMETDDQSNIEKTEINEQTDLSRVDTLKVSPPDAMSEDANQPLDDASPRVELDLDKVRDGGTEYDSVEPNAGDDESQTTTDVKSEPPKKRRRGGITIREDNKENTDGHGLIFPAQNVFEYQWPQDERDGEWYFVQEQITEYLGVTSFKRKYPDIERRVMPGKEKDFLRERGVVTEEQVTLGLTALKSDDIYDLMMKEYPDKYKDYIKVMREKEQQSIKEKKKAYAEPIVDESKRKELLKKAAKQASEYNSMFMRERREERAYYFDMQTLTVQVPANKMRKLDPEYSKPGPYPVALIPGQFQNYYRTFTSEELKYFPINTALYGPSSPRRQNHYAQSAGDQDGASDDDSIPVSLSGDESLCLDSMSSSSGGSDSDSSDGEDGEQADDVDGEGKDLPLPLQPPKSEGREVPIDEQPKQQAYMPKKIPDAVCGLCLKDKLANKTGEPEDLVHCSQCDNSGHPSCLEMTEALVKVILSYPWQCMECKTCMHCGDPTHEDKMMFCDDCDRGYHTFCVGLKDIPTGKWACESCATTTTTTTTVTLAAAELPMEQASLEPIPDTTNSSTDPESTPATESEATAPESSAPESAAEPGAEVTPNKPIKRRGRPPGSKNKPKDPDASPKEKKTPKEKKDKKEKKEGGTPASTKKAKKKLQTETDDDETPKKSPAVNLSPNSQDQDYKDAISESPGEKTEAVTPKVKKPRGRPPKIKDQDSPSIKKGLNKKQSKNPQADDDSSDLDTEKHDESEENIGESSSDEDQKDQTVENIRLRSKGRPLKKPTQTPSSETQPTRQSRSQSAKKRTEENPVGNDSVVEDTETPDMSSSAKRRRGRPPKKYSPSDDMAGITLKTPVSSIQSPVGRPRRHTPKMEKETPKSARQDQVETEPSGGYQGSPLLLKALQTSANTPSQDSNPTELQMEETAMETEPPCADNTQAESLSRASTPASAFGNESETEVPVGTNVSTPLVKKGRGRPRKDRSTTPISNQAEAKKRKTDTPTPGETETPEKENKESEDEEDRSKTDDEETSAAADSPSVQEEEGSLPEGETPAKSKVPEGQDTPKPKRRGRPPKKDKDDEETSTAADSPSVQEEEGSLPEGETPAKSKFPEGQDTPTPKRRGRPPKKDKDKDTPTPSAKKGRKPRKKADQDDGDMAETSDSTPSTPLPGTPRAGTPIAGTPKDGDGSTPVAKRRGRPPKIKDSPAAPAKRAKKQTQEDDAESSTLSIPQVSRLQAETPVESPASSNQDSESVITGTEAPSESNYSSEQQTPDITPSPTPDSQDLPVPAPPVITDTPVVTQPADIVQKVTDSSINHQTEISPNTDQTVPMEQGKVATSEDAVEPMQVSETAEANPVPVSSESPAVSAEEPSTEPATS